MYLGQRRQGDVIMVTHRAYLEAPTVGTFSVYFANPKIRVYRNTEVPTLVEDYGRMGAYEHPSLPGLFRLGIKLASLYNNAGPYTVRVEWLADTVTQDRVVQYYPFEILPGGDEDGSVIAMCEVVRPDTRFLLNSTTMGRILRRKNPRVNQ